jgi:hypothetical protein
MRHRRKENSSHFLRLNFQFFYSGDVTTYSDDLCTSIDDLSFNLNILFGVFRLEHTVHVDRPDFDNRSVNKMIPQCVLLNMLFLIDYKLFILTVTGGSKLLLVYQCQFLVALGVFFVESQIGSTLLDVIFQEEVGNQVFHFGVFEVVVGRGPHESHHLTISKSYLLRSNVDDEDTVRKQTESVFESRIHLTYNQHNYVTLLI